MREWRKALYEALKEFNAPRVMSNIELQEYANSVGIEVTPKQIIRFIEQVGDLDVLTPVRKGLFLNNRVWPTPTYAEAACRIRSGAVVSLHTVLGDAGVLNNSTSNVYSLLPAPEHGPQPSLGSLESESGVTFHFNKIKAEILEAGDVDDRLVPLLSYDRATPEAAVVHWIYLANTRRSPLCEPDTQCDMEQLDLERLERLATAAGIHDKVFNWVERCRVRETADDDQTYWQPGM